MVYKKKITVKSFCQLFRCSQFDLPDGFQKKLESINTNYKSATKLDGEQYVLQILKKINSPFIRRSKEENIAAWEKGWAENLAAFQNDSAEDHLKPRYFHQSRFFRYNKRIIIPENPNIEYDLFTVVRYFLFKKYFKNYNSIYELGCGSCQNILMLSGLFPEKNYVGLDWSNASKKIADVIASKKNVRVTGYVFDMLNPTNDLNDLNIDNNSLVFSIHALEQLGRNYSKLISFLINKKPALVIHYEPIVEFYDKKNVYDYLAVMYSEKRNYLSGYLETLRNFEKKGKVEIIEAYRPYIGGIYHEASLVVWRPV
ncbi:MAG: class I SAM-dependent methyltransferase [Deltaproteobacteria bacterium]|nr:class I SAM-dependent methyltransferase [Deltaproteobacteria bacterium]